MVLAFLASRTLAGPVPAAETDFGQVLAKSEWRVRDVAAGSDFRSAGTDGRVPGLNLNLTTSVPKGGTVWRSKCIVTDTSGSDRAVTLAWCVPLDARGSIWWDDPTNFRRIASRGEFAHLVDNGLGATGFVSRYPIAAVSLGHRTLCIGLPIEPPRMARLLYDAAGTELRAEFDFGLSGICEHFPSRADASVIAFDLAPAARASGRAQPDPKGLPRSQRWEFRRAIQHYWELYPEAFRRRVSRAGIWLPFQHISIIDRPEDFGFAFHEVALSDKTSPGEDDKLGVGSYVYTEPMTDWRALRAEGPKTYSGYMKELTEDALEGDKSAQATLTSGVKLANGRYFVYLTPVAYTPLSPFGVNCDPDVPTADWPGWPNRAKFEMGRLERALGWAEEPGYGLDGIYVDSMESGWSLGNYRRDHWRTSRYPLTFDPHTKKVCLANFWGSYAFIKELTGKLHSRGMLLMGNDAFYRYWFLAPYVDIPGREYAWSEGDRFVPVPDERYLFFRSMAGHKPYLMLMNDNFDDGSRMLEYFQRSLFWAVYPSMFHAHKSKEEVPYFYNPEWYNRDRELFKKYIPLIRRLDEAGWQPVTDADVRPAAVRVERYGRWSEDNLAFALHNPTGRSVTVELRTTPSDDRSTKACRATEWISESDVPVEHVANDLVVRLKLPARGYAVVGFTPTPE